GNKVNITDISAYRPNLLIFLFNSSFQDIFQCPGTDDFDAIRHLKTLHVRSRNDGTPEAKLRRFNQPLVDFRDASHLTGQADLADETVVTAYCRTFEARGDAHNDAEVHRRLFQFAAAGHFDIGIVLLHEQPFTFLEHRHEERQAVVVYARCHPSRIMEM